MYDIDEKPQMFLRVAIGILFMNHAQLGYDTSFVTEESVTTLRLDGNTYEYVKDIYTDRSIRGRGTACFKVKCTQGTNVGKVCVVKDAWVDRSRGVKEVEILNHIQGKGLNIPEFLFGNVVKITTTSGEEVVDSTDMFRGPSPMVEIRDHYRIVMTPCGVPIWQFASLTELLSAMIDVING